MCDCTKRTIEICGEAYDAVIDYQHTHKKETKRHLNFERAVNQLLIKAGGKVVPPMEK